MKKVYFFVPDIGESWPEFSCTVSLGFRITWASVCLGLLNGAFWKQRRLGWQLGKVRRKLFSLSEESGPVESGDPLKDFRRIKDCHWVRMTGSYRQAVNGTRHDRHWPLSGKRVKVRLRQPPVRDWGNSQSDQTLFPEKLQAVWHKSRSWRSSAEKFYTFSSK